jgi:hypothetical protein
LFLLIGEYDWLLLVTAVLLVCLVYYLALRICERAVAGCAVVGFAMTGVSQWANLLRYVHVVTSKALPGKKSRKFDS